MLLDTSVVVDIDRGGIDGKVERLDDEGRHAISVVTVTELRLGVNNRYVDAAALDGAIEALDRLLARFDVHPITRPVGVTAADVIATLSDRGEPINDLHDIYIAATGLTERLPVLTANVDHFNRVDDLTVIDWKRF